MKTDKIIKTNNKTIKKSSRKKVPYVKSLRQDLGLTQVVFCQKTGISQSKLSKIESGTHNITMLVASRIHKAFKVSGDEIIKAYRKESRQIETRSSI